jgi:hypothetical protein
VVAQNHPIQTIQSQVPDSGTDSTGSPDRASSLYEMKPLCLTHHQPTDRSRAIASLHSSIQSIGQSVISQKKAEILATTEIGGKGRVEKRNIQGRDLLSLLIKANIATDIPDSARMTDEEIQARE